MRKCELARGNNSIISSRLILCRLRRADAQRVKVSDRQFVKVHSKSVLFLCTGNYYRSRFAEELFNHYAAIKGLNWVASSAALAVERCAVNVGPLSPYTLSALNDRGIRAVRATQKP